jgi:uncharacterized protein with HEPN domain
MPRDPEKYLLDIREAADFLLGFVSGRVLEDYIRDRGFRSAIERELQIIGEALLQLERLAADVARRISEYRRIIGFRHVLVHGYHDLDPEIVWFIVHEKLPTLRAEVASLLEERGGRP